MIKTYITYKLIEICLNTFFDDIDSKLIPLDEVYTDIQMCEDIKFVIHIARLSMVDINRESITLTMIAQAAISRRRLPFGYYTEVIERMYSFLLNRYNSGKPEYGGAKLVILSTTNRLLMRGLLHVNQISTFEQHKTSMIQ